MERKLFTNKSKNCLKLKIMKENEILGPKYEDNRGTIQMLLESCQIGSISKITSFANTTRANHWHKEDGHFIEVLLGEVELYERPVGSNEKPIKKIVKPGEISFTESLVEHTMYFPCETIFNCYSLQSRNSINYENETTRFNYSLKNIYDNWK